MKRCHGEDTLGVALRENSSMPSLILRKEREEDNNAIFLSLFLGFAFVLFVCKAITIKGLHKIIETLYFLVLCESFFFVDFFG